MRSHFLTSPPFPVIDPETVCHRIRGPLDQIPGFGIRILQLGVSISRMESFFAEGEVSEHAEIPRRRDCKRLRLVGATLRYAGAEGGKNAIEDATIDFPEGRLTVVSGPTGSGKTSSEEFLPAMSVCRDRR